MIASGAVLAALAFVVLPYYSIYSGSFLAAQTLDEKWWLELILAVLPLVALLAQQLFPPLKEQQRRLSLLVAGCGVLGILIHYWFMEGVISSNYWRLGSWSYFLGMAVVALGGLLLAVGRVERRPLPTGTNRRY
jgi:ABC-type Fe3+ transport system permease subunit